MSQGAVSKKQPSECYIKENKTGQYKPPTNVAWNFSYIEEKIEWKTVWMKVEVDGPNIHSKDT